MFASLVAAALRSLLGVLRGWLGDRRADANAQNLGAATAATETLATIAETADARSNLAVPDDAAALAGRLRDAARREAGDTGERR